MGDAGRFIGLESVERDTTMMRDSGQSTSGWDLKVTESVLVTTLVGGRSGRPQGNGPLPSTPSPWLPTRRHRFQFSG